MCVACRIFPAPTCAISTDCLSISSELWKLADPNSNNSNNNKNSLRTSLNICSTALSEFWEKIIVLFAYIFILTIQSNGVVFIFCTCEFDMIVSVCECEYEWYP